MVARRTILRDALKRKMHALLSTMSVGKDKKVVTDHWEELQRWCDMKQCEFIQYRFALWKSEIGLALKTLLGIVDSYDAKKHLATESKLRQELLKMYESIGWELLVDNEKRYQQMHF